MEIGIGVIVVGVVVALWIIQRMVKYEIDGRRPYYDDNGTRRY